ncbi:pirin family protein [Parafrigoribacterium mesophilum]|uniref:pirin family protein n=1 Tax=Parafrigoribacterium mesophilum TaxID=433646 RepID=UPI0031FD0761
MSNLEKDPPELVCAASATATGVVEAPIQLLEPRMVPLGGPRAMTVRRTLPQRSRSLIGAWCFIDHYGPDDVAATGGMVVPPHPHTGLQTVSWLFAGEIEHRDSSGAHATVRPGELNLMTAGGGIQHSEVSTPTTTVLHGVQLWTALPDAARHGAPFFERFIPPVFEFHGASVSVFLGSLLGHVSTATAFTPIVGAQFDLPAGTALSIPVDSGFEHGILVDTGEVDVDGVLIPGGHLGYRAPGSTTLSIRSGEGPARILLLGGAPFGEQIVMWWNFIGRTHEEVVGYRTQWQTDVVGGGSENGRFNTVRGYDGRPLPAPTLPNVRLRPRG